MAARFSLAPPTKGDENFKSVDIVGVPSLEWIKKFSGGNVGVAQSSFDSFLKKSSAGLDDEVLEVFSESAKKNNESPAWGLPALESTLVKSVFETQKPYIDAILAVLDGLVTVEDIIAVLEGGIARKSLKPKTNRKSLYAKLKGIKSELEEVRGNIKPTSNSFANFSFSEKLTGISSEDLLKEYDNKPRIVDSTEGFEFDWVTVSTFYSTGNFVEGVPYQFSYINIIDEIRDLTPPPFDIPEARNDDNPPTIIFDVLVDKLGDNNITRISDPNLLPNEWDISTKWFGEWERWTKNESKFITEYTSYIDQVLEDEFDKENITDLELRSTVKKIFKNALPDKKELYRQYIDGNFKEELRKEIDNDILTQNKKYAKIIDNIIHKDKIGDFWSNDNNSFSYKPKKVNNNWIDPEIDYHLRLIRVFPTNSKTKPNPGVFKNINENKTENKTELSGSNPLVYSYGGETLIDEVLHDGDYLLDSSLPNNIETNGYTISKTARKYPPYERRTDLEIIDKIRKNNSKVIEKVVVSRPNIVNEVVDIFEEIEKSYRANTLNNILQNNLDKIFKWDNGVSFNPTLVMNTISQQITDILEKMLDEKTFEEFGRNRLFSNILRSFQTMRNSMQDEINTKNRSNIINNFGLTDITRDFKDIIDIIKEENFSSDKRKARKISFGDLSEPESLYGKIEVNERWQKLKDSSVGANRIYERFYDGDVIGNVRFVGDSLIEPSSNLSDGELLNETFFTDSGIFYIVEGVYKNRKDFIVDTLNLSDGANPNRGANAGISDEKFYKFGLPPRVRAVRSLISATSKFTQFAATTLFKIIKENSKALSTFKNPFNLIFEVIFEQMSENFKAFDPDITKKFSELKKITNNEEKRQFIKNDATLRNFIALDSDSNFRFIFDGIGVISLFGQNFGLGIKNILPNMILESNGLGALFCDERPPKRGDDNTGNYDEKGNIINNVDTNGNPLNNGNNNRLVNGTTFEIISTEYSTGNFIEGINYQYYYITLDNQALVNKANNDLEKADKIFDEGEKIRLKLLALEGYQKALVKDPSNVFLNKQLNDVTKQNGVQINMIFQLLISIITIPIKIVICIIEFIIDFFTSIKITELPTKIPEFLQFDWILEFFKPTKILALMGIELNPDFSQLWKLQSNITPPSFKFDVSKILAAPFLGRMPLYSSLQYPHIVNGGPKMLLTMGGLFTFLEGIINQILCFIFNLFNLEKLFECPTINLSRFVSDSLSAEDINKLLEEADYNFLNQTSDLNNNETAFVFDVTLENGEIVKDLNRSELQAFVASNRNLRYKYNFDGVI